MEIKEIKAEETYEIRHRVMWPKQSIDFVKVEEDAEGFHYGLFVDKRLISVVSVFYKNNEAQFRKFATLEEYQGRGYGSKFLKYIFEEIEGKGVKRIFCNARSNKTLFYEKFGMTKTKEFFIKESQEYVIMEKIYKG